MYISGQNSLGPVVRYPDLNAWPRIQISYSENKKNAFVMVFELDGYSEIGAHMYILPA